jgi:hypothetical protein
VKGQVRRVKFSLFILNYSIIPEYPIPPPSLKIDTGPSEQATGFLELSNVLCGECFRSFVFGFGLAGS